MLSWQAGFAARVREAAAERRVPHAPVARLPIVLGDRDPTPKACPVATFGPVREYSRRAMEAFIERSQTEKIGPFSGILFAASIDQDGPFFSPRFEQYRNTIYSNVLHRIGLLLLDRSF